MGVAMDYMVHYSTNIVYSSMNLPWNLSHQTLSSRRGLSKGITAIQPALDHGFCEVVRIGPHVPPHALWFKTMGLNHRVYILHAHVA